MKMSPSVTAVLLQLAAGQSAERKVISNERVVWFIGQVNVLPNGKSITRAIKSLLERGFAKVEERGKNNYAAVITEEGRAAAKLINTLPNGNQ
jgi:hypothetical protein